MTSINTTNPYWTPPISYEFSITNFKPLTNTLGFQNDLVWRMPTSVGEGYSGAGQLPGGPRELVYSTQGEYTATDNIVPSTGGKSLVNLYDPIYAFQRSDRTVRV